MSKNWHSSRPAAQTAVIVSATYTPSALASPPIQPQHPPLIQGAHPLLIPSPPTSLHSIFSTLSQFQYWLTARGLARSQLIKKPILAPIQDQRLQCLPSGKPEWCGKRSDTISSGKNRWPILPAAPLGPRSRMGTGSHVERVLSSFDEICLTCRSGSSLASASRHMPLTRLRMVRVFRDQSEDSDSR